MFEIVNGRRTDDGRTPEHGYTISSSCEPEGSGELITFIESYYFLCDKENVEQIYRNMCLLIHKLFVAYLNVPNILVYN